MRFEMNIDYTVTALMFPAIPLIMAVYSNRFHTLSALIRKLHDEYVFQKQIPPAWEKQLHNLNKRTNLLRTCQCKSMRYCSLFYPLYRQPPIPLYSQVLQI